MLTGACLSGDTWALALSIGVPAAFALVIISGLLLLLISRRSRHHSLLWGGVLPPGPGRGTTLLVSHITDWFMLWEEVDSSTMEMAVMIHDRVMRQMAAKHAGYEAASGACNEFLDQASSIASLLRT